MLNLDVFDLDQLGQFDLVVVISTIEHVGRDEEPQDPTSAVEALHALEGLVAPGGRLLLTVPIGYHHGLDAALRSRQLSVHAHLGAAAHRGDPLGGGVAGDGLGSPL